MGCLAVEFCSHDSHQSSRLVGSFTSATLGGLRFHRGWVYFRPLDSLHCCIYLSKVDLFVQGILVLVVSPSFPFSAGVGFYLVTHFLSFSG